MVDMVAKAKALIAKALIIASSVADAGFTGPGVVLTPDGMRTPEAANAGTYPVLQVIRTGTLTVSDPDLPAKPEPEPETGKYSFLPSLAGLVAESNGEHATYPQPAFESPEQAWKEWIDLCGPVGEWKHEVHVLDDQQAHLNIRALEGCVHVRGVTKPDGSKPHVQMGATKSYHGDLKPGGVFIENVSMHNIDAPNDRQFLIAHNVDVQDWSAHALITSPSAKHLYVEILDSTFWRGHSQHGLYIDNVAYANIQRNRIESAGHGHALRSIAQRAIIKDNIICNAQCDGSVIKNDKGQDIYGSPPVDIYVNGETLFEGNHVSYTRKHANSSYNAATFRARPAIQTIDRVLDESGEFYKPLVWGTDAYQNPESWGFQMIETLVKDMTIECHGESPCDGWIVRGTYPRATIGMAETLLLWWRKNAFQDWQTLLSNAHPDWHNTLNLMTDDYKQRKLSVNGAGLGSVPFPLAVPDGWRQKARITFENVNGDFERLHYTPIETSWCDGATDGLVCLDADIYSYPEIVIR